MKFDLKSFKPGVRDGIPIALGYLAVSFGFGIIAVSSGLTWYEAMLISMLNLTSAGQLAAVPIIASGGSILLLALTQLTINMRYALMSISLSQSFDHTVMTKDEFLVGFANTDEIFAVVSSKGEPVSKSYMLGLASLPYIGWTGGTVLGALAGSILPELIITALSVSLYAMFISIIVPAVKTDKKVLLCASVAILFSVLFTFMPLLREVPSGLSIVIITVAVSSVMAILFPIKQKREEEDVA